MKHGAGCGSGRVGVASWEQPSSVRVYRQPEPPRRTAAGRVVRVLGWLALGVLVVVSGLAGGMYLWLHQSLAAVQAHTVGMKRAQKHLVSVLPGQGAIALVLGDNQRSGIEASAGGRSDTMMLVRADPKTNTISLLSLPRDLQVPVYCPRSRQPVATTRIDYAFAYCGAQGSLDTVQRLTGLRINYLVTVNYRGFKDIVNEIGGIWLDIDRSYYNKNVGTALTDYSNIDLQPGYQLLSGGSALQFVRFRHTDSDFYRQARDQEFIRALKDQIGQKLDLLKLPRIVSAITRNVEIGACRACLNDSTVLKYALFALTLPHGHLLQNYLGDTTSVYVGGADELAAPQHAIRQAVHTFTHPAVATTATKIVRTKAPAPADTTITVLNGNGVPGAAAIASELLAGRGYRLQPPRGELIANAPTMTYADSHVYYGQAGAIARSAAFKLAGLIGGAAVAPLSNGAGLGRLDPGSMLVVVLGKTFQNRLGPAPARIPASSTPLGSPALTSVRHDTTTGDSLLAPLARRVPFALESPTIVEGTSMPDTLPGDQPVRLYAIAPGYKAVRLVFHTGGNSFWGIEETNFSGTPILDNPTSTREFAGRRYQLYYSGSHLHMVVLETGSASYWIVNSLLDSLSNQTMLAIARGLRPLPR